MYKPTAKTYFSGAGGMDYGLMLEGIDIIQSNEIEPVFSQTLKANFNHNILTADIKNLEVLNQPRTDIMVGTYPCKKYSTIADISGTRTGDELFLHMFRHIALEQPEVYVIENVPGMKKFAVTMEAMTQLPGYYVNVFCPVDASNWLPQKRKRLILVGTKKRFNMRPPESDRKVRLRDIIEENPYISSIPKSVCDRINGKYRDKPIISDPADDNACAPTCVAHYSKDKGTRLVKDKKYPYGVRPYSVREYARLQGFPDTFNFCGSEGQQYVQIGNAVAVPMARWIGKELIRYFN